MKDFKNDIEAFGEDFIFVIYKAFGRFACPKWAKKDYLQQHSKALQVKREK
jgi:hypothetical protein